MDDLPETVCPEDLCDLSYDEMAAKLREWKRNPEDEESKMILSGYMAEQACREGYLDIVRLLIEEGLSPEYRDKYGTALIHRAMEYDHVDIVQHLADEGVDLDKESCLDGLPLFWAIYFGNPEVVRIITSAGADVNAKDKCGQLPLVWAVKRLSCSGSREEKNQYEIVKVLLEFKATLTTDIKSALCVFDTLIAINRIDILILLLENGSIDVNIQDAAGWTPAHNASIHGRTEFLKVLLDNGADMDARNVYRETPLHIAALYGNIDIVKVLVTRGADRYAVNYFGESFRDLLSVPEDMKRNLEIWLEEYEKGESLSRIEETNVDWDLYDR